jgi:hypothetical protein
MGPSDKNVKTIYCKRRSSLVFDRIAVLACFSVHFSGFTGLPTNGRRAARRLDQNK